MAELLKNQNVDSIRLKNINNSLGLGYDIPEPGVKLDVNGKIKASTEIETVSLKCSTLDVSGIGEALKITNNVRISGNLTVDGLLSVGTFTFGDVVVAGNNDVSGNIPVGGFVDATNYVNTDSTFKIQGSTVMEMPDIGKPNNFRIPGTLDIVDDLNVLKNTQLTGVLSVGLHINTGIGGVRVNGQNVADFTGAVTSITVKGGIVVAIS